MNKEIILEEQLVAITIFYQKGSSHVDFTFHVIGLSIPDKIISYQCDTTCNWASDKSDASPFIKGTLKWDGCCDWYSFNQLHFCGLYSIDRLSETFKVLYKEAKEILEK